MRMLRDYYKAVGTLLRRYEAIGTVANPAPRLYDEVKSGQILIPEPVHAAIEEFTEVVRMENLTLKGLTKSVPVLQVVAVNHVATEPNIRRREG